MKTYHIKGIKWDCDDREPKECGCPTETYIEAEDEEKVVDALSGNFGYCVESVKSIAESTPKEAVEFRTNEMLGKVVSFAKEKIKKALNCGAVDIESYESDYQLPKIILHAVMKAMVDETRPLFKENLKESNNLYHFL